MAGLKRNKTGKGGTIDSPFTHFGKHPGLEDAPGIYGEHPKLGPPAADHSLPIKTYDTAIDVPSTPLKSGMDVVPAKLTKS